VEFWAGRNQLSVSGLRSASGSGSGSAGRGRLGPEGIGGGGTSGTAIAVAVASVVGMLWILRRFALPPVAARAASLAAGEYRTEICDRLREK